ncbi:MAG TPA: right-handed parallel beta-helix repeat-containing protein [Kofleriaceae bacterium]|nr:right-handed parallel beta-helix repeat-containing protein [Kofleriaceae bacterium]
MRAALLLVLVPSIAAAGTYEIGPGDDLFGRLRMLAPGDEVIVHAGTYTTPGFFEVAWAGTEAAPIVVRGADGERPVIAGTLAQNVIDLSGSYFTLRGFELRGGSHGIRLGSTDHAVLEDLVLHDLGDVGISCNRPGLACAAITIRGCEIFDTGKAGTGEGMYLGCNDGDCAFTDAIVERNYVHDLGGDQGDGIEVKTGATAVTVRDNVIARSRFPGITMYGYTGAGAVNVVERNLVLDAGDNGIQIVGQVRVRNNLVLGSVGNGIHSKASQGLIPDDVEIVHNTVVGAGGACLKTNDWALATTTGQLIANNALYCPAGTAVDLNGGAPAARLSANVGLGASTAADGFFAGRSVEEDFDDVAALDFYPAAAGPLHGTGDPMYATADDFDGCPREEQIDVGIYDRTVAGRAWIVAEGFKPAPTCHGSVGPDAGPEGEPGSGRGGCCDSGARGSGSLVLAIAVLASRRRRRATASTHGRPV